MNETINSNPEAQKSFEELRTFVNVTNELKAFAQEKGDKDFEDGIDSLIVKLDMGRGIEDIMKNHMPAYLDMVSDRKWWDPNDEKSPLFDTVKKLEDLGFKCTSPRLGEEFNPHEQNLRDFGPGRRDQIIGVESNGYSYKDKIIRKPHVVVGRG